MVTAVYILLFPQEKEVHSSFWGHKCTRSAARSLERFKPLSVIILLWQGHCCIGKNTKQGIQLCLWCLKSAHIALSNSYLFLVLMNVPEQFFLIKYEKFLLLYLGCGCINFNFMTQINLPHLLPMPMNKRLECKDHQIYSKILRKIDLTDL